ncbi:putative bifunctional diguanylate cyclase/phosphodiesterase [Massilia sp. TWR1-2-2]|uniref:putative bifunctional diguanylate cyclase/phosphodiesterase n=1 Tax=Massilia sp. TWR1-2-2 TaxID=2804584 RepID=UPI003CEDE7DC
MPLRLSTLALLVSVLIGVLPPLALFALQYRYQSGEIAAAAHINARLATEMINRNPELWQFEQLRLEDLLGNRPAGAHRVNEIREIVALSGTMIARSADAAPAPLMVASAPLFDAGRPVGALRIARSLRPLLVDSLFAALAAAALAALLYFKIMTAPLRALRRAFDDLDDERERALITLRSIGDAVVTTDTQRRVQYLNPIAELLTGWTNENARGKPIEAVLRIVQEGSRQPTINPVVECLLNNAIVEMDRQSVLIRHTDQCEFHIENSAAPIRRATGEVLGAVLVFHDVSERKQAQNQLHHIAHHDALTGLPNRTLFRQKLEAELYGARAQRTKLAVLFLDLDRFKRINDTLGHHIGDRLLVMVGNRLRKAVRASDTIARMGGDEFTAILGAIGAPDDAYRIADTILAAIARPFTIGGHEICVTTSVGIAFYPDDGAGIDVLLQHADVAMYQAKDSGRNGYRRYAAGDDDAILERLQFENALRNALGRGEFFLEYQPKLDLATRRVTGMEALLRWQHDTRGVVAPDNFIPLLEESGQIVEVGEWVLRTALAQALQWAEHGFAISIAVNFSPRQFESPDIAAQVATILSGTALPAALLEIEVTESLLMQNDGHEATLRHLKSAGIGIALDDFGTGYSSLSYLRSFPVDVLKIDKSFVDELACDARSLRIARTIVDLGHALEMRVVAEGVETAEQCGLLAEIGCDVIQGYWLSRPMRGETTLAWLHARQRAALQCDAPASV